MRMVAQVVFVALLGAIGGFWITLHTRPDNAHAIMLAVVERLPPSAIEIGRRVFGQPLPTLNEAWSEVSRVQSGEHTPRTVENALVMYERAALRELREMANDPASFALVSVRRAEHAALCVTFRATNGFGALMLNRALVVRSAVYPESAFDQRFAKEWDQVCARSVGEGVADQAREVEKTRHDLTVLKAERASLARPERIEEMAAKLGLSPVETSLKKLTDIAQMQRQRGNHDIAEGIEKIIRTERAYFDRSARQ